MTNPQQEITMSEMNTTNDNGDDLSFEELLNAYDTQISHEINAGDKIEGKIISIGASMVYVSTGTKSDGVVDRAELLDENGELPFKVGDTLELYVVSLTESEIILSRAISGVGSAEMLEDASHSRTPVEGRVTGTVKGGFSVDVMGKRAFCPVSQIDTTYVETLDDYVGNAYHFIITRYAEGGRNIVLSRRDLLEEEMKAKKKAFFSTLSQGDIFKGTVTRLMPYGAFVELTPGIEGMVHISELSWSRVDKPGDLVSAGDTVTVKVLGIETGDSQKDPKISLSMKQVSDNPWDLASTNYKAGDQVTGTVVRLAPFGAFVEIEPGIDGLVHLSEMSHYKRIVKAEDAVSQGERVQVVIKEIDTAKKRISLSMKDASEDPWLRVAETYTPGTLVEGTLEKRERFGLFVNLEPGITALMPSSVISASPSQAAYDRLKPGDPVSGMVDAVDEERRRISIAPPDSKESDGWKDFAKTGKTESMGTMGSLLMEALKKKS